MEVSTDDLWYPAENIMFIAQHHLLLGQKRANAVTDYASMSAALQWPIRILKRKGQKRSQGEPERVLHSV